jgi:histidinol-phosphate aminotransferase
MTPSPRPLPEGFGPYVWAATAADVARRHGLPEALVLRFDANVPALPGVPQVPLSESFARLNEYPPGGYSELHAAAAQYTGVEPEQIVPGAGADGVIHLIARTYLAPGRRAAVTDAPTYPLYSIASAIEGAEALECRFEDVSGAEVVWVCNPHNPSGSVREPEEIALLASRFPDAVVVVDEAYVEYGARSVVPLIAEQPNLVAVRTLSKAFGFAALRVGYAVASPEVAAELRKRGEPAPVTAPSARLAAAALRDPRTNVEETVHERERMREALLASGYDCPPSGGNFVLLRNLPDAAKLGDELEAQGLVLRRTPLGLRATVRLPAENDRLLAALGVEGLDAAQRSALVVRTTTETALRVSLVLDGQGRARVETGVGFLDHLLTLLAFHAGLDLDLQASGDLHVDEHHTVEDVLAALGDALDQALGDRAGLVRYGSATLPMDEARGIAAVDLVRRPHAELRLAFGADRVGGLPLTLLPHALERFAMQARLTLHVEAEGNDDHHVAEAAFKALARALRQACARTGDGAVGSTKGEA